MRSQLVFVVSRNTLYIDVLKLISTRGKEASIWYINLRSKGVRGDLMKSSVLAVSILFFTLWGSACSSLSLKNTEHGKYNILFISMDTFRADRLGVYGNQKHLSPQIDEFAEESIVFRNAFVQSPYTLPSHISMLSGVAPDQHKIWLPSFYPLPTQREDPLTIGTSRPWFDKKTYEVVSPRIRMLAEILKENGYSTAWFANSMDSFLDVSRGFSRGFDEIYPRGVDSQVGLDTFLSWLDQKDSTQDQKRFFAFVHTKRAHLPYIIPDDIYDSYEPLKGYHGKVLGKESDFLRSLDGINKEVRKTLLENPKILRRGVEFGIDDEYLFTKNFKYEKQDIEYVKNLYDASVKSIDESIAAILYKLEMKGLKDSTIVIITSDHGEELFENGSLGHGFSLSENAVHVPLIIYVPGAKSGKVDALAQSIDIAPTLLDLTNIPSPVSIQGKSLLSYLHDPKNKNETNEYVSGSLFWTKDNYQAYLRNQKWKFISNFSQKVESLYDIQNDPGEQVNLIHDHPIIAEHMRSVLSELVLVPKK